ncbi:MAG: ATP-binding protein, partial [Dysosmobacter sp.]|nr:ATP-binding protein [Dysosmobacter sp.]
MTEIHEDEYLDPADGLIHCRKCRSPRQVVITDPFKGGSFKPRCVCPCQQEKERRRREAEERRQRMER